MGLGLQFVSMPVGDQASLARYLEDYRFHVAVALAGGPERRPAERALASRTQLHFAASAAALARVVERGDVAAVVAFAATEADLEAVIAATHALFDARDPRLVGITRDRAPRLIPVGPVPPAPW